MAFLDVSVETANTLYAWGWRASIVGAVLTSIGVVSLMWGTMVRDQDFENRMAQTNLAAARANERAASAELELAKLKTPRRLEVEHLRQIEETANRYQDVIFYFSVNAGDPEATNLMVQLGNALRSAGWNWLNCPGTTVTVYPGNTPASCPTVLFGNQIHFGRPGLFNAAQDISAILNTAKIGTELREKSPPSDAIHILIGKKPT